MGIWGYPHQIIVKWFAFLISLFKLIFDFLNIYINKVIPTSFIKDSKRFFLNTHTTLMICRE